MRYWVLTALLVLAFLLQSVLSSHLAIAGVAPDLVLVVVLTFGLLFGWEVGLGAGVLGGLLIDMNAGRIIGLHVLSLGTVGLAIGLAEGRVFKDNLLLAPLAGFVGTAISKSIAMICLWLLGWYVTPAETFRSAILPGALYNMVLATLVYNRVYKYYQYLRPDPRGTIIVRRS